MPRKLNYIEEHVDISQFPSIELSDENNNQVLGDLHANAQFLVNLLVRFGFIQCQPEQYFKFVKLYQELCIQATISLMFNRWMAPAAFDVKNALQRINQDIREWIDECELQTDCGSLTLIGDEVGDRGASDLPILLLIEKMVRAKIALESIFSNHGYALIRAYFVRKNTHEQAVKQLMPTGFQPHNYHFFQSILGLQESLVNGLVSEAKLVELVETYYFSVLKLVGYSVRQDKTNISLKFHAGGDHRVLQGLIQCFDIAGYDVSTLEKFEQLRLEQLTTLIDLFNERFLAVVRSGEIVSLVQSQSVVGDIDPIKSPLFYIIQNRNTDNLHNQNITIDNGRCQVTWIHGHNPRKSDPEAGIIGLDSDLGKINSAQQGVLRSLCLVGEGPVLMEGEEEDVSCASGEESALRLGAEPEVSCMSGVRSMLDSLGSSFSFWEKTVACCSLSPLGSVVVRQASTTDEHRVKVR